MATSILPRVIDSAISDVMISTFAISSYTIAGSTAETVSIPYTVPDGYSFVGIICCYASNTYINVANNFVSGSNIDVGIRNLDTSSRSIAVFARILFKKSA